MRADVTTISLIYKNSAHLKKGERYDTYADVFRKRVGRNCTV